jgi:hypothetical protein
MIPADRHQHILEKLNATGAVRIEELSQELHVSTMTIHRDLDALAREGRLRKVRGGAIPIPQPGPGAHPEVCLVCLKRPLRRTQVVLHLNGGSQRLACCAHCGLMALLMPQVSVASLMVTDFLHERMLNAKDASYLVSPDLTLCCTPTVLAFETDDDAGRFQEGFGGERLSLEEALDALRHKMRM